MHFQFRGYSLYGDENVNVDSNGVIPVTSNDVPVVTPAEPGLELVSVDEQEASKGFLQDSITRVRGLTKKPDFLPSAIVGAIAAILAMKILR